MSNILLSYQGSDQQQKKRGGERGGGGKNKFAPIPEQLAWLLLGMGRIMYLNLPTTNGPPPLNHLLLKEPSCSGDKQEENIENV